MDCPTKGRSVYLLAVPSGAYKIGIAANPRDRLRGLQTGNPERITLVRATPVDPDGVAPDQMERWLHGALRNSRVSGEWFRADREAIDKAWAQAWSEVRSGAVVPWEPAAAGGAPSRYRGSGAMRSARWRKAHPEKHAEQQRRYRQRRKANGQA